MNFVGFEKKVDDALANYYSHPGLEKTTVVFNHNLSKVTVKKIDVLICKLKLFRSGLDV